MEATAEPITHIGKNLVFEDNLVVNMEVEPSLASLFAPGVTVLPDVGAFTATSPSLGPPSPGSPIEKVVDCVLGLPAECPTRPVVVPDSVLVPLAPNLKLVPNLVNPFINTSHPNNSSLVHYITLNPPQTKASSYLEITKLKPSKPLLDLKPVSSFLPDPNSFTLITSYSTNKPVILLDSSLQALDENHSIPR